MEVLHIAASAFTLSVTLFVFLMAEREGNDIFAGVVDSIIVTLLLLIAFGPLLYKDVSDVEVTSMIRYSGAIGLGACVIVRFLFSSLVSGYMKKKFGVREDPKKPES
ncbi:TPA: hypothetical protein DEP34_05250 [Candidatus Uhrbacteria bacterium]|uniref:Uncharacterized protein n=2 Tax=Candidatus Uhriibacteriota TaxID=1752732 RepID=A0A0G1T4Y5_9BACT|nr:MAG: hypothetical protein UX45_C0017G0013 [Candidatus Uhrbacteria bacterium GW2011_GWF2_46_218]KKU40480.1 MAG: hypothetical protein UX57_C0016G0013 [Candidatus Uhrbacteria bacterium GW2011_GWE2_46_68]HBK34006.1 hypothetical protein [Candidatus Uhrbacteria bacterium]HCB19745.1 hypothetical protein [Candidatus Uhrbacteria bacterium]